MSQDASTTSTRPTLANSLSSAWTGDSGGIVKSGGFSVESYADRLMDELFEDVEQSLDMGNGSSAGPGFAVAPELLNPPESPLVVQPEPPFLETENLAATGFGTTGFGTTGFGTTGFGTENLETETALLSNLAAPSLAQVRRPSRSYDRFLLGFGCLALVAAGVFWLLLRPKQPDSIAVTSPATPTPAISPVNPADSQFSDYAKQVLQTLAERSPTNKPANLPIAAALPGVAVAKTPTTPPRTGAIAIAPIYGPSYPLSPNLLPRTAVAPSVQPSVAVRSPEPAVPTISRTLVGVMELGDRSAALVEIAGVVQRFRIGESISASGWTLVEISKNQAVIRRNGEVRSIFIGQAF